MSATSLDLSQIKTDALSAASSFRTLIGLGSGNTPTFLGTTLTGGTVTASAPIIDGTQTWNSAGTAFTGMRLNVTDTASSSSSLLMDLQTASTTRFRVWKDGSLEMGQVRLNSNSAFALAGSFSFNWVTSPEFRLAPAAQIVWATTNATIGGNDLVLVRDAAQTLAQRNAGNAQTFRIYNTFTNASNYERGKLEWSSNVLRIGTEKAGTGSARALELQTDGTTRLTIGTTGVATFSGRVIVPEFITETVGNDILAGIDATGYFFACGLTSNGRPVFLGARGTSTHVYIAGTTGVICARGKSIAFGITTSNTSLISESSGTLSLVNQADSQSFRIYNTFTSSTNFERLNLRWASNEFIVDAEAGSGGGTLRGIKIGGVTTSLLGFYGATPVDRPDTVADPAGGSTVDAEARTAINAIIDRLQELGLIA